MSIEEGIFYVVATPIGNLDDMSPRAVAVLQQVDLILAEDTRHSARLLQHYAISTPMRACHEHNEASLCESLPEQLRAGQDMALISDAGTPLVSDPGFRLVRTLRARGIRISTVPGPCASIAALSISGLPSDRFAFEGFLPAREAARQARLQDLLAESRTLIFYEAPHRLVPMLATLAGIFGSDRRVCVARELTKRYESVRCDAVGAMLEWLCEDENRCRGEIVVLVEGAGEAVPDVREDERLLRILLDYLPVGQAASAAAEIGGGRRNRLYKLALSMKQE